MLHSSINPETPKLSVAEDGIFRVSRFSRSNSDVSGPSFDRDPTDRLGHVLRYAR